MPPEIMTAEEVGKYMSVHLITVYRLIKTTNIPTFKLKGQWRFKKSTLDAWIDDQTKKRKRA
jgi:excisionase family DNA binding protein